MKDIKGNLKHSISAQLLNSIFRIYLFLAIIITAFQLKFEFDNLKIVVVNRLKAIEKTFAPALANASWQLDEEGVNWILKGIMSNNEIVGIKMKVHGTKLVRQLGLNKAIGDSFFDKLISYTMNLEATKDKRLIGKLTLFSTNRNIIEQLKYGFFLILINSLIKTILLWFIMVFYVRKILANPIEQLTDEIRDIREDNLQEISIDYKMDNEILVLERSFNKMVNGVQKNQRLVDFANKTKSEFLMNMGHELKTPINQINGFTTILKKSDLNTENGYYLDEIDTCTGRLLKLINNILYLSKSVDGELTLDEEIVDFELFFKDVLKPFEKLSAIKALELNYILEPGFPKGLFLDEDKVSLIFNEILTNAVKFTNKGTISIKIKTQMNESNKCSLIINIVDTGIGIPEDMQEKVYENFVQLNADEKNKHGGTGLGLSLVKRLIELMGGEIKLNSTLDKGSDFQIIIPNLKIGELPQRKGNENITDLDVNEEEEFKVKIDFEGERLIQFNKEFEEVVLKDWKELLDHMDIEGLLIYAVEVKSLGEKYEFETLMMLADKLKSNIDIFDIEAVPKTMTNFHIIRDELIKKIKGSKESKAS